jgi:2-dehydropantoate 2-reductase
VGAGAVGCFYASRLHRPSANLLVSLVCRSNYEAIASKGVTLRTRAFGNYVFTPEHVFPSIPAAAKQKIPWDYVVVTTKALPDVSDDSELIHDLITSESSTVVLIQNGVGVEEPYRKRFPKNVILSAVTIISAEQVEHGVIVQNRWTRISIGPYTDGLGSRELGAGDAKIKDFVGLLSEGGIKDAELYDERGLQMVRWHKIAVRSLYYRMQ